jgi:hypothetical protein
MDILQTIIGVMNKEEVRHYKLFINRTEKNDRKDEVLFDYIRTQYPNYTEEKIQKKLYATSDKNALYRLKHRLLEDVGRSFVSQYYDANQLNSIANHLTLSRLFHQKSQFKIAYYYLNKAERKALHNEYLDWLDIIYSDFIKLSHETLEINPEIYINKREQNRLKLNKVQQIDDILAALIYRIKTFASADNQILQLLQKTVNDFSKSEEVKNSPVLRFKIYNSVSRILLQQQNYKALEKYLLKTHAEFLKEKLFNENNHDTKLQMLTYLINSLFKNKKIDLSLEYAEKLKAAMSEYNGLLYDKYLFYYYNSLVINYSIKDVDKALEILNEAKNNAVIKKLPMYNVFIYLNLAVLNFGKGNFKAALKSFVKPLLEDDFHNLDEAFRLKLNVFELIIRYELNDTDYVEHKIAQIKKEFKGLLKSDEYVHQQRMISILNKMITSTNPKKDKKLLDQIHQFSLHYNPVNSDNNDIVDYIDWLKKKV